MRPSANILWFWRISCCIYDLSRFFLMYSASCFGEELCVLDPLHKINMIWQLLHKSYLLFLLWSNLLWCCNMFYHDAAICYNVIMVYSISIILMLMWSILSLLHYELRCVINDVAALAILWQMYEAICCCGNELMSTA